MCVCVYVCVWILYIEGKLCDTGCVNKGAQYVYVRVAMVANAGCVILFIDDLLCM